MGAGGIKAVTAQRAPMTMDEILGVLITKAKTEAEEAQRSLIAALNGLAALMLVERGQAALAEACAAYREAVHTMEANKAVSYSPRFGLWDGVGHEDALPLATPETPLRWFCVGPQACTSACGRSG